jgi:chromosome partitioning protein
VSFNLLVANAKGGVGKTTTAVTVAHALAALKHKVLLIDLDAQGHVCTSLGLEKTDDTYRLIELGELHVKPSGRRNLDVIGSNAKTVQAAKNLPGRDFSEQVLVEALEPVYDKYEFIVLDTPPGINSLTVAAIMVSTHVLVPVACEELALDGLVEYSQNITRAKRYGARTDLKWITPTMYDRVAKEIGRNFLNLNRVFPNTITAPIPRDAKMREAPSRQKTIWEYAPRSRAGVAYLALVKRILNDLGVDYE